MLDNTLYICNMDLNHWKTRWVILHIYSQCSSNLLIQGCFGSWRFEAVKKGHKLLPPEKQWIFWLMFLHSLRISTQKQNVHHEEHWRTFDHNRSFAFVDKSQGGEADQALYHSASGHAQTLLLCDCLYCALGAKLYMQDKNEAYLEMWKRQIP